MNRISDLFKDKYNSLILREYVTKLIKDMTELKRANYYDQQAIIERNKEIKDYEQALTELRIEISPNYDPNSEFDLEIGD